MASITGMLSAPFCAGASCEDTDISKRDGSISATVLGACIQTFAVISLFLMYISHIHSPTEIPIIVWEFISVTQCVGLLSIIILACFVYHKRSTWEINSRQKLGGRKFIFLWIFGLASILQASCIASINISCMQSPNNTIFNSKYMYVYHVSLAKNCNSILFYALQIGFISYFYRVQFEASKVVNYCMMLIMTATIVEYVNSILSGGLLNHMTFNSSVSSNYSDSCYFKSPLRQFFKQLYIYTVPAKTEFSLLSSACLLQMWSACSPRKKVHEFMDHDKEITRLNGTEKTNYRSINSSQFGMPDIQTYFSRPISMYVTMVIGALFSLPVLIIVCLALYVKPSSPSYINDWEAINIYTHVFLFVVLMMTFYQMSAIRDSDFDTDAFDWDEIILTFCACGVIALYCFDIFAGFMSVNFPLQSVRFLLSKSFLGIINIFLQTVLILQGNKIRLTFRRPESRIRIENLFLFLHIMNVAVWLATTLTSDKIKTLTPIQQDFYGSENWTVVFHIFNPLFLYYRFQSSLNLHNLFCKYRI